MSYPQQPPPPLPYGAPPPAAPYPGQGWHASAPAADPYAGAPSSPAPYASAPYAPASGSYAPASAPYAPAPAPYAPAPGPGAGSAAGYGAMTVTACRMCGSVPAAAATFRGHQGFIIVMRFLSLEGPFCRDCGLATFRRMTSRTLVQGWYGWASFIITPITVLINLVRRGRVANLGAPQPNPFGPSRPPMDPGPRLLQRPMTIIGLAVPFALVVLIALLASQSS